MRAICRGVVLTIVASLCLSCTSSFAQRPKVLVPNQPVPPKLEKRLNAGELPVRQSAVGALWMTGATKKAALYLKNGLKTDPITVTPILYLSNGGRYPLSPVTLEPSGTSVVDLNQGLANNGIAPYGELYGYAEIEYQWPWAAVTASIRNVDQVNSLIFVYGFQQAPAVIQQGAVTESTEALNNFEGAWWKQEKNVSAFLALANVTDRAVNATVRTTDSQNAALGNYSLTISPHSTKMLSLTEVQSTKGHGGGVYVSHDGPDRALAINSALVDDAVGYSANVRLLPSPQTSSSAQTPSEISFAELGLMTGAADPMMNFPSGTVFTPYSVVRNISDQPATVTPTLWWMTGGVAQSAPLPQLNVAPHRTLTLNVPAFIAAAGLKNFNGSINLVLDTNAEFGALLLAAGSVDQTNTYVFEVIPRGVGETASQAICYWSTGNGDDTMVTLWNAADEEQDLVLTLFFSGGHYAYPIQLPPRATGMLNISEILHSSFPDAEGNLVPAGLSEGSAEIAGLQGEHQHVLLSMDAAIYNVRKAICGQTCITCNGVVNSFMVDNPYALAVGGSTQQTFYMQYNTGSQFNLNAKSTWSSSATSVATVSSGLVHGVSAGSSNILAQDNYTEPAYNSCALSTSSCTVKTSGIRPSGSSGGRVGATPINFALDSAVDAGGGDLHLVWSWESSSGPGKLSDLSTCSVSENVTYPGTGNYTWPTPFPLITSQNPTPGSVPGSDGTVVDDHDLAGKLDTNFRKPYSANSFAAQQTISYSCTYNGKALSGTLFGVAAITRSVAQNTNGSWNFNVVEPIEGTNYSATINPLP